MTRLDRGTVTIVTALGLSGAGGLVATIGGLWGFAHVVASVSNATNPGYAVIPIGAVATGLSAIGTVVWVAKKVVKGELVPLPVSDLVEHSREREDAAKHLAERALEREATILRQGEDRERQLREALTRNTEALAVTAYKHTQEIK